MAVYGQRLMRHFQYAASVESEAVCDVNVFAEARPEIAFVKPVDIKQVFTVYPEVATDQIAWQWPGNRNILRMKRSRSRMNQFGGSSVRVSISLLISGANVARRPAIIVFGLASRRWSLSQFGAGMQSESRKQR